MSGRIAAVGWRPCGPPGGESRPTSELAAHQAQIRQSLEPQPARTIAEACQRIAALTGVARRPTPVSRFWKGLGRKRQRVRALPVPPKTASRNTPPIKRLFSTIHGGPDWTRPKPGTDRCSSSLPPMLCSARSGAASDCSPGCLCVRRRDGRDPRAGGLECSHARLGECHQHHRRQHCGYQHCGYQHRHEVRTVASNRRTGFVQATDGRDRSHWSSTTPAISGMRW